MRNEMNAEDIKTKQQFEEEVLKQAPELGRVGEYSWCNFGHAVESARTNTSVIAIVSYDGEDWYTRKFGVSHSNELVKFDVGDFFGME